MLDNPKLWTFNLAINHGLNDVLNPPASQSKLEKHSRGRTGHAMGRLLQGAGQWRMSSQPFLAAKLWSSSHKQQLATCSDSEAKPKRYQRSLGLNAANLN